MFHSLLNLIQVIQEVYGFTHSFPGLSAGLFTTSTYCAYKLMTTSSLSFAYSASPCCCNLLAMGLHLCFLLGVWSRPWWVGCVLFSYNLIQENEWGC